MYVGTYISSGPGAPSERFQLSGACLVIFIIFVEAWCRELITGRSGIALDIIAKTLLLHECPQHLTHMLESTERQQVLRERHTPV